MTLGLGVVATIPSIEPRCIVAGDTVKWRRSLSAYPAGTWVLRYDFRDISGEEESFSVDASADGFDHLVEISADDSKKYAAGDWRWFASVSANGERYQVGSGDVVIKPSPDEAKESLLTQYERILKNLLDAYEKLAGKTLDSVSVNGRSYTSRKLYELDDAIKIWRRRVNAEKNKNNPRSRQVLARFVRA